MNETKAGKEYLVEEFSNEVELFKRKLSYMYLDEFETWEWEFFVKHKGKELKFYSDDKRQMLGFAKGFAFAQRDK